MEKKKAIYERPQAEVVEFSIEDNIAASTQNDEGAGLFEGLFN